MWNSIALESEQVNTPEADANDLASGAPVIIFLEIELRHPSTHYGADLGHRNVLPSVRDSASQQFLLSLRVFNRNEIALPCVCKCVIPSLY